ncbi:MAG: NAD(P)/FAD-dependent oxidoreductase [Deltaproteobacteria bacterium]|nr:NAD(P)/FAD-dependent oxidoreductase [Deltaproteobacteria bacterium]
METNYDAVIIGAGMGGLSCGTLLAKEGLRVLICEQSSKPGGYCQNFRRNGFTFAPAVHYLNEFGPHGSMKEAFQTLGLPPEIEFCPQDPQRRIITPNFHITLSTDIDRFERDLIHLFPSERLSIHAYIRELKRLVKSIEAFSIKSFDLISFKEKFELLYKGLFKAPQLLRYRGKTGREVLDSFFKDPLLKHLLTFGAREGSSIFFCASPIMWAIKGDFYYIKDKGVEVLPQLFLKYYKAYDGDISFNTLVKKIVIEGGKARGVQIEGGEEIQSRHVISNGDGHSTFQHLIGKHLLPDRFIRQLQEKEISGPVFTLYLGVDLDLAQMGFDGTLIHYYPTISKNPWEEKDMEEFDIEKGRMTIRVDSIKNPMFAPMGKHTVAISTFVPYELFKKGDNISPYYTEIKEEVAQKIIDITEKVIPGLSSHIMVRDASTPITYERETLNRHGAAMGWYLSAKEISSIRTQKTPIANLYQAGHWTFPGGGIPMVIISGINAAKLVLKSMKKFTTKSCIGYMS